LFEQTFKRYSYSHIRNVFVTSFSAPFIASCPQARHVGFNTRKCLPIVVNNCPHLEVLAFDELFGLTGDCKIVVDSFLNLRTIQVIISTLGWGYPPEIDILTQLNHLQTVIIYWDQRRQSYVHHYTIHISTEEQSARMRAKWIESVKHILIQIQLRDNLEKTIVVREDGDERRILLRPKTSIDLEE